VSSQLARDLTLLEVTLDPQSQRGAARSWRGSRGIAVCERELDIHQVIAILIATEQLPQRLWLGAVGVGGRGPGRCVE
jgi:hypothetical protein